MRLQNNYFSVWQPSELAGCLLKAAHRILWRLKMKNENRIEGRLLAGRINRTTNTQDKRSTLPVVLILTPCTYLPIHYIAASCN